MQRVRRPLAWVKPAVHKRHTGRSTHHIGLNPQLDIGTPIAQALCEGEVFAAACG